MSSPHDPFPQPRSERRTDAASRLTFFAVGGCCIVFLMQVAIYLPYFNDDAYITFRYSRFLALGRGPYFNVGEHVEGYTNFLLMLLLAAVIRVAGSDAAPIAAKAIGIACGLLGVLATFALALVILRRLSVDRRTAASTAVLAAGIVAVHPEYAVQSTSGLETLPLACATALGAVAGMLAEERGRWYGAGIAFAAAALTRPEGAVLFAVFWTTVAGVKLLSNPPTGEDAAHESLLARWLPNLLDGFVVGAVVGAHLIFRRLAYDGEWLPNTYYAKTQAWSADAWMYIQEGTLPLLLGWSGLAAGTAGWISDRRAVWAAAPVLSAGIFGACLPFLTGTDWMIGHRPLVPYFPFLAVLAANGWRMAASRIGGEGFAPAVGLLLLLPLLWWSHSVTRDALQNHVLTRAEGYRIGHLALAEWMCGQEARAGDTIALMDIGAIGYRCIEQRVLDITGLTDRFIAKSPGSFLGKDYDAAYVLDQKPLFIVLTLHVMPNAEGSIDVTNWTAMEQRLQSHPDFRRWYVIPEAKAPDRTPLAIFAAKLGAEKVFQHLHPEGGYLLAVYRRREQTSP